MALPHSETWDLVDLHAGTFEDFVDASFGDVAYEPEAARDNFRVNAAGSLLEVRSSDGKDAALRFGVNLPARFTLQLVLRCPQLPHNLGDLTKRRFGLTLADDAGRGFSLYLAKTGVAISRVDHYGAVTALPDTTDVTAAVATAFHTVRIAVDGGLGRAYVFVGEGATDTPPLRWIIPVDDSPAQAGDAFRFFVKGLSSEPVLVEFAQVRLGSDLVLANYPPIADAGADRVAPVGQAVRFDGRASYDVEGAPLGFLWQCIDAPYGSRFAAEVSTATFIDDGDDDGMTSRFTVPLAQLPDWLAQHDVVRLGGAVYEVLTVDHLTGLVETTSEGMPEPHVGPLRLVRQSILLDAHAPTPTAVPDVPGLYRFRLVVNDGESDSEPAEVLADITPLQTPFGIEPDAAVLWKALGDEWSQVDGRDVFTEAWIGVTQLLAGKLLEAWQTHYNSSIRDAQRVYQRKWIGYRTFESETAPDEALVEARYGGLLATHAFELEQPALAGMVLRVRITGLDGVERPFDVFFAAAMYDLAAAVNAINAALSAQGVTDVTAQARVLRSSGAARLMLVGQVPFRLSGTACGPLGFTRGVYNSLRGETGARITDRTYYAEGVDLVGAGVKRGDLLVLNNGESFRVDRVLSDSSDPHPNQRVLLVDALPADASPGWEIPSVIRSAEVDYERAGVYPGDLAKTEILAAQASEVEIESSVVVAEKDNQLAVHLNAATKAALRRGDEVRFIGVKRRKAIPLPQDVKSVPFLQEIIPVSRNPKRLQEHVDYILEPFFRDVGRRPIPMLQFADSVFIESDLEPPDVLWAEVTLFDNTSNVENLFGRLVGFLRDDAASFPKDFDYVSGVAGLLYAQQRGPSLFAMTVGAQILLGQPFAEVEGFVEEIRSNYSPTQGRILIRDADGNVPTESETVRAYYYKKNPDDHTETSGLAENPVLERKWQVGDSVPQFSPLGAGIVIDDVYTRPNWWKTYVGGGTMYEIEKFHRFVCTFDLSLVDLTNINLLAAFLYRVRPTYTRQMLIGDKSVFDDIDITDRIEASVTLEPHDSLLGNIGFRYDDYRGDGQTSSSFDDDVSYFDALDDSIWDSVDFHITVQWPGGTLTFPTKLPLFEEESALDVNGTQTGEPGRWFLLVNGMTLAAGAYGTYRQVKAPRPPTES